MSIKKVKTCPCGEPSVPGLVKRVALCQKHYNGLMFGQGIEHREALDIYNKQNTRQN